MSLQTGEKFLHEIVSTVSSSLELTEVLRAVVRLMSEASGVHACFAYLLEEDVSPRAASPPRRRTRVWREGRHGAWRGPRLVGGRARRTGVHSRERARRSAHQVLPRARRGAVQSLLALPVIGRSGEAIGVITAHTEAPREFSDAEVDFLVTSASLVAGAIENARLYEETRLRVAEARALTELAEAIARAEALDDLLQAVIADARPLLAARACHVYLLDPAREELDRRASDPEPVRQTLGLAELGPELARGGRSARLAIPLVASDELIGSSSRRAVTASSSAEPSRARSRSGSRRSR